MEPLVSIIVALILIGVVLWVVQQIPMDPNIRLIIRVVVLIAVCLWLLSAFGLWGSGHGPVFR